jgi:hypothetical protein
MKTMKTRKVSTSPDVPDRILSDEEMRALLELRPSGGARPEPFLDRERNDARELVRRITALIEDLNRR